MTKRLSEIKPILPFLLIFIVLLGLLLPSFSSAYAVETAVVVQTEPVGSPGPPITVELDLDWNDADDYAISRTGTLVGEISGASTGPFTYRWRVVG